MNKSRILPILLLFFATLSVMGVPQGQQESTSTTAKEKVHLLNADSLTFDAEKSADYRVLHGNVRFRKDSMYMYCDSAYFYEKNNSLDAFGNVRMEQGDTLFIYGDVLYYDGTEQLAELRHNVRLINRNVTLTTDSLNYDMTDNIGYYFAGGSIVDEKNELVSLYGEYSTATKDAVFNFNVVLTNEDYVIYSDTLRYNTDAKISYLFGPSTIVSDSNTIYTTNGWYDTNANHAMLLDRSRLVGDQKMLTGDTLYYDRNNGVGEAFGNMFLIDSVQSVIMEGHYGFYNEITDYTFATDSARVLEFSRQDTLYLHADTLMSFVDSDSTRILRAYHGVRFYRANAQGVCDSLQYIERDTTLTMYTKPVLWSGEQQIFGDTIRMFFNDSTIDWAHIINNSFATQGKGGNYYDQMEGNEIKAYFEGNEMRRMETLGNVLAIFYPQDSDSTLTGMLNTEASFLNIFLENNEMKKMVMWPSVKGKMFPIEELTPANMFLSRYVWYGDRRPIDKDDIFRRPEKSVVTTDEEQRNTTSHKFNL